MKIYNMPVEIRHEFFCRSTRTGCLPGMPPVMKPLNLSVPPAEITVVRIDPGEKWALSTNFKARIRRTNQGRREGGLFS